MSDVYDRDTIQHIFDGLTSPNFSHTRVGNGLWRNVVWIYARNPGSPSGVTLSASGTTEYVEPMLAALSKSAPCAPYPRS